MLPTRLLAIPILTAALAFAHCDSLDGPVVQAARRALVSGDVNLVLPWIQADQEAAIRQAFRETLSVRKLSPGAEQLADTWFFETLVRTHRAGEGAPYDGLKPAGSGLAPVLRAADEAVASGALQSLEENLTTAVQRGLRQRFSDVLETKKYPAADIAAGRRYVAAYVRFIHFAEKLDHAAAQEEAAGHAH